MRHKFLIVAAVLLSPFVLGTGLAQSSQQVFCTPWNQVNEDAFGLGPGSDNDFSNEEGFEALEFKGQLYLGMEADNASGARLWRTKPNVTVPQSQADWEEVAADEQGNPFGIPDAVQNDHIDSLMAFNNYLYVSTANRSGSPSGIRIFRSADGNRGSWQDMFEAIGSGFGDRDNENFKDMQIFQGELCGGTWNLKTGAQVWCSPDGLEWSQRNTGGFGEQKEDPSNARIWSAGVFDGGLYFGVQNNGTDPGDPTDDVARLYRSTDIKNTQWVEVFHGESGSRKVDILGHLAGHLYISTEGNQGILIFRSPSGDAGFWEQVNLPGMGNQHNEGTVVDGATLHSGALYVSLTNWNSGVEVWRTLGIQRQDGAFVDWKQVSAAGFDDANNTRAQLVTFNNHLYAWTSNFVSGQQVLRTTCPSARYIILFIGDGIGAKHLEAYDSYTNSTPTFAHWTQHWMTTYPEGAGYSPSQAWSDFQYVTQGATDSAAAATAMFTGEKTVNQRISVSSDGSMRLFSLADKARMLGKGTGAVTSVYLSHATPGAWYAHNDSRYNGFAIADEGLWGHPNTSGDPTIEPRYAGDHGATLPALDVIMGAGHPSWNGGDYVNIDIVDLLVQADNTEDSFRFIQRIAGSSDGGMRLAGAAQDPETSRLVGLFGGTNGNLEYRLADGSGSNAENPTLAEMAAAAITVLSRNPYGFTLMIEGGAIDWASHQNNMDQMIGEMADFSNAIQRVVEWIDDPGNDSSWQNTLVAITGDHETGYLSAAPGAFTDQPLGSINPETIKAEKTIEGSARRASWDDTNGNAIIDPGESVYWAWNLSGHTNSLIPLFIKGSGAELFDYYLSGSDPMRGPYMDNTDIFRVLDAVTVHSAASLYRVYLPLTGR
ncbi:MAG TPA: alkaline phosphatase [Anaerolineales bacterium]